jgi:NAD(P)-dependent dehydrogenase (short-subunit alcohol dehydrogenase family)
MSDTLTGRHAFITGGGGGIGAAVARRLHSEGCHVTVAGRDLLKLEAAASGWAGAHAVICDVTDEESVERAVADAAERHGAISILVNNAGVAPSAPLLKTSRAEFDRVIATNLTGTFLCARAVLPGMLAQGFGRIVNVASTAALKGYPYVSAYVAAKHGVLGLTRSLALEVAAKGVTVNAVCPGFTDTDIVSGAAATIAAKTGRSTDEARAELARSNPQGRLLSPDEVASTVAWLCRPESGGINGAAVPISGGEV